MAWLKVLNIFCHYPVAFGGGDPEGKSGFTRKLFFNFYFLMRKFKG